MMDIRNKAAGRVVSVNTSLEKGQKKQAMPCCILKDDYGVERDAHAGMEIRQVSLLAMESIGKIRAAGLDVGPGDFAENITTEGIILHELSPGTRFLVGEGVLLELTQVGKVCHNRCAIFRTVGDCVMPREGVFVKVLRGGEVKPGDEIRIIDS